LVASRDAVDAGRTSAQKASHDTTVTPMFAIDAREGIRLERPHAGHAGPRFALVDANRTQIGPWFPWVEATRWVADTAAFIRHALDDHARASPPTGL